MVKGLYVAYDKVAQEAGPVFEARNDGIAMRAYRGLLQQVPRLDLDAYKLLRVGEFDSDTCQGSMLDVAIEINVPVNQLDLITEVK